MKIFGSKMKITVQSTILLILASVILYAGDNPVKTAEREKAGKAYARMFEAAHPSEIVSPGKQQPKVPFAEDQENPLFYNHNTITGENGIKTEELMQNESSVAVNPLNPYNLIASAVDYRVGSSTWIYVSNDGGKTWENQNLGHPFTDWRSTNDPSVVFGPDGTGYLVYGGFGNTNADSGQLIGENGVFLAKTTDQGATWKAHIPVILHTGEQTLDSTFEDKYYISVDMSDKSPFFGDLYIPWKRVTARDSATQIVLSKSTDEGETWSEPVNVSYRVTGSSEDTTFGQSFPLAATGPGGDVYVVWNHGIEHGVGFAKSTDGGKTFSEPEIIHHYNIFGITRDISVNDNPPEWRHTLKGSVRAEAYPVIAADITGGPRNGFIYVCWAADNIPNIYFSRSEDGGQTWSDPVIVHSVTGNDQFWPWMSIDPLNGDLSISYFDSRNDPQNQLVECFVSYSSDGGLTWTDRRAADFGTDISKNPFYGHFAGDYSGNAFYDGISYPTWVDMRNAKGQGYFDSDVYTAVVNTRAPMPPENFTASTLPEEPNSVMLKWDIRAEMAFGQPLKADEFQYAIYRDGVHITDVPGNASSYKDTSLEPYKIYDYKIHTFTDKFTSKYREASAYAGGARLPDAAEILSAGGAADNTVQLHVRMPALRADHITPLVNLAKLDIYRDGELLKEVSVNKSDTGQVITFDDTAPEPGWYVYAVSVKDESDPPNESQMSANVTVYTGKVFEAINQNFDSKRPRYLYEGSWGLTDKFSHSGHYSVTDSPEGDYDSRTNFSLALFPVAVGGNNAIELSFWHAAIVDNTDEAVLEYSRYGSDEWTKVASYYSQDYAPWSDGTLTSDDWKPESYSIAVNPGDTILIRYRLYSNVFRSADGWYIDDISVSSVNGVGDETESASAITVYPNPADQFVNLHLSNDIIIEKINITDVYGNKVMRFIPDNSTAGDITIPVNSLCSGVYFLRAETASGSILNKKFLITD